MDEIERGHPAIADLVSRRLQLVLWACSHPLRGPRGGGSDCGPHTWNTGLPRWVMVSLDDRLADPPCGPTWQASPGPLLPHEGKKRNDEAFFQVADHPDSATNPPWSSDQNRHLTGPYAWLGMSWAGLPSLTRPANRRRVQKMGLVGANAVRFRPGPGSGGGGSQRSTLLNLWYYYVWLICFYLKIRALFKNIFGGFK